MRKLYLLLLGCVFAAATCTLYFSTTDKFPGRAPLVSQNDEFRELPEHEEEEKEGYDGPDAIAELEFQKTKDPTLGYVPYPALRNAIAYTYASKNSVGSNTRLASTLLWQERGPNYDSVGPSNGNTRGGNLYTSGRMRAVLIDTLNDPTGNTVIVGGVSGGVWKCTNFLSAVPNWKVVNDYFANMAIGSICQDPSNANIMYFATGEAASNADAHYGEGIWKSVDAGETWTQLPSTLNFIRNWRIKCDNAGNVYVGARTTGAPAVQTAGLLRSKDGGLTWTNITPALVGTATATATCTDLEISSTGKMYASFGYLGTIVRAYVTNDPANVTQATGWTLGTGIRTTGVAALRMELACIADTVYGVTINSAYNSDSCYKSIDGGVTWTKQNTTVLPGGLGSGQGWYNLTLAINPSNSAELLSGGLDAYRSVNSGATWTRTTFWVTTVPYVHADHHFIQWWNKGSESRVVIGCDGGVFYSNDGAQSWLDKNRNLALKQFYATAIHPAAGSPYLLAGAQDNGCHQLKNPGLSYSIEVTGGDGMYVYINQLDPNVQFGSYVYNQYRRSLNGGQTWQSVNLSTGTGLFANPFDYDDAQNIMYACFSANNLLRWPNANTATAANTFAVAALNGQASGIKVSPYTANRVYLGSTTGRVVRLDNANATPTITNITGTGMPTGYINCVNVGSNDNFLVATYTNYGVMNVWYSSDAGTTWTGIDGNLPNMPVWWALFDPSSNDKLILGTETGVWTTEDVDGAGTVWTANPGIPTTRVSMMRMRTSDNTIVAATYGRGLFTAQLPATPQVNFVAPSTTVTEQSSGFDGCRGYKDYNVNVGIVRPPTGDATVTFDVSANNAVRGSDFDFTTNGNFASPSNQHVFVNGANGATALKSITVRIYDDAEVESPESFNITFTVSGTTDAVAGPNILHSFTINDDDRYPSPYNSTLFATGASNFDLTTLNTPFDGTKLKHRLQVLYRASELKASGINLPAVINSMRIRVKTKNTTQAFKNFRISIANVSAVDRLNAGFVISTPFTIVYSGNYSTVTGNNDFTFTNPFNWDGNSNIVVQYCFDNSPGTAEGVVDIVEGTGAPFGATIRSSTYSNHTTSTAGGCYLAAAFVDDNRVNASFGATFGDPVAVALNSNKSEYISGNNDLYYYTPGTHEILARVLNLSGFNYGCTQVVIDRAGIGASQFWNNNTSDYLMNKTFRIIPGTNSPTGSHEVTFYFTRAEKEGWEAATGQSWNNIQIVKLPSRISNVSPANAQPDGPGTIKVIDAVKRSFGPDGYTLSAIFDNGFGAYGFGIPGRMNTILVLTGSLNANGRDIDLSWTTSAEINSSVFEIEKSYNGTNFHRIGVVQAAGNKLTPSTYTSVDRENVQENYFRIKMMHTDGYVLYSNVVYIQKNNAPQKLFIYPNPFTDVITIRLARNPVSAISASFYDMSGKLVRQFIGNPGSPTYTINTSGFLASGYYVLKVLADDQQISQQVLKRP